MTYQKSSNKISSSPSQTIEEPSTKLEKKFDKQKKELNNETTLKNRECQATVAKNHRINSSNRTDVEQTTDFKAFGEMFEYIQSDSKTLDEHCESKIAAFYANRSVFITGASGFVGKVS